MPPTGTTKPAAKTPTVPPADLGTPTAKVKPSKTQPVTKTKAATAPKPPAEPNGFNPKSIKGWAFELGTGYGWRNAQNGNGLDHKGINFYGSAGLQGRFGRHTLTPKFYVSSLGLSNDLGFGFVSEARATGVGVGANYNYHLGKGIGIGANLDLGIVHYSAKQGSGDGSKGFGFGGNGLLLPVSNNGIQLRTGLRLSFFDEGLNVYLNLAVDSGVNPEVPVVDGGNQRHPGNFSGRELFITANPVAFYNYLKGNRRSASSGTIKHVGPKPSGDKKPVKPNGDKKPVTPKQPVTPKKTDPAADFKGFSTEFNIYIKDVAKARKTTEKHHKDIKKERRKGKKANPELMLYHADRARKEGRGAHDSLKSAKKTLNLMKEKSIELKGDDQKKAYGVINQARKDLAQAHKDYFYAYRSSWKVIVREYARYRKTNKGADEVKFDLEKYEWSPGKSRRTPRKTPRKTPKKTPKKTDFDKKKPPKKPDPKPEKVPTKKKTDFD